MPALLLNAPILPGKLDAWRRFIAALLGERKQSYATVIRETGLERLRVWHQHGPDGSDLASILYEGPAPERFLGHIAGGSDEFCRWFRGAVAEAHGFDLSLPPPPLPELAIDQRAAQATVCSCSRVRVEDPRAWRRVMDEMRGLRLQHGQVSETILVGSDDEHEITVVIGWRDAARAKEYYAHAELRAAVARAGGVDGRGLTWCVPS